MFAQKTNYMYELEIRMGNDIHYGVYKTQTGDLFGLEVC